MLTGKGLKVTNTIATTPLELYFPFQEILTVRDVQWLLAYHCSTILAELGLHNLPKRVAVCRKEIAIDESGQQLMRGTR